MNYLKNFVMCFLLLFFVNYLMPGFAIISQSRLPHIGVDLIFPLLLGLLNASLYPILKMMQQLSLLKLVLSVLVLNFVAYAVIKFMHTGLQILDWESYLVGVAIVCIGSFLINFFEMRRNKTSPLEPPL